jgi:hypothetical protein
MKAVLGGVIGALLLTIAINGPAAYAQAVSRGAPAVDVLATLLGQDVSADTFTATTATGPAYVCGGALASCLDTGAGANNSIGTDASGRVLLATGAGTGVVRIGDGSQVEFAENGNFSLTNGAAILNGTTAIYNQTAGASVPIDAPFGIKISAKSLAGSTGCVSTREGATVWDILSGGTTGAMTRVCRCTSDGAGTPAYTWVNTGCPNTVGTATTCPACP